jgi:hypothetical protein
VRSVDGLQTNVGTQPVQQSLHVRARVSASEEAVYRLA